MDDDYDDDDNNGDDEDVEMREKKLSHLYDWMDECNGHIIKTSSGTNNNHSYWSADDIFFF